MTHTEALRQTVRVLTDGTVIRGIGVPHMAANIRGDNRVVAAAARAAHTLRFAPNSLPKGVDEHLPCDIEASRRRDSDPKCVPCRTIDRTPGLVL